MSKVVCSPFFSLLSLFLLFLQLLFFHTSFLKSRSFSTPVWTAGGLFSPLYYENPLIGWGWGETLCSSAYITYRQRLFFPFSGGGRERDGGMNQLSGTRVLILVFPPSACCTRGGVTHDVSLLFCVAFSPPRQSRPIDEGLYKKHTHV